MYTSLWQYALAAPDECAQHYDPDFPQIDLDISTTAENELSFMLQNY